MCGHQDPFALRELIRQECGGRVSFPGARGRTLNQGLGVPVNASDDVELDLIQGQGRKRRRPR